MKKEKIRLDELLVKNGLCDSREKAQRIIGSGKVKVEGLNQLLKPSTLVEKDVSVQIEEVPRFVSRGGEKLEKAINEFHINPQGLIFADIGASTGGFTDCLIQRGAAKVYAIDVGYGQLHEKIRCHPQVVVKEKINARYLTLETLGEKVDGVTIDVSFISLRLIFPSAASILKEDGLLIALIKPQFEASRQEVKKGLVKEKKVHEQVLEEVLTQAQKGGFSFQGLTFSPIRGAKGNIEFLGYWRKGGSDLTNKDLRSIINQVVEEVHYNKGK
ncbi:MAG TPA: TlyA family RNA methyltransferase [Candidatus Atribacteria bacterium]|nr:TlyA family RNA methyltransferase [Candidatus Atribacteria bacterium]